MTSALAGWKTGQETSVPQVARGTPIIITWLLGGILGPLSQLLIIQRAEIQVLSYKDYVKCVGHMGG